MRDVEPGEVLVISDGGLRSIKPFPPAPLVAVRVRARVLLRGPTATCSAAASTTCAPSSAACSRARRRLDADVVVPIPDSGVCAATGFAEEAKLPLRMGLIRNHYVGRTFIQPQQSIRHFGVKVKLNPVRSILEGKRVVLLDDSLVRGTTSRKIVKMVKAAGRARSAPSHQLPADHVAVLLRRRHAEPRRADRVRPTRSRKSASTSAPTRWPT